LQNATGYFNASGRQIAVFPVSTPLNGFGTYYITSPGGIVTGPFIYVQTKAIVLSGGNLEITNATGYPPSVNPSTWTISRGWGVDGNQNTLALIGSTYANSTLNKVVVQNWDNGGKSSSAVVIWQGSGTGLNNLIATDNGSSYSLYWQWREFGSASTSPPTNNSQLISSPTYGTGLHKEYEIKLWDAAFEGFKSFVSANQYSFEWQVSIAGSVVIESITGTTRNYSRMFIGGANWCSFPFMAMIATNGTTLEVSEWDVSVNGDKSCLPTPPPPPPPPTPPPAPGP